MEMSMKSKRIIVGVIIFLLLAAVITLSVFVGLYARDDVAKTREINGFYQSAYYGLVGNFVDIENDLAKSKVMTDKKLLMQNLLKIDVNCNLAAQNMQVFYGYNDGMQGMMNFVNQLGDYCVFLFKELERGKTLMTSQVEILDKMWVASKEYGRILNSLADYAADGYTFAEMLGKQNSKFDDVLKNLTNSSIEYPSLIYDGPFSDGLNNREVKGAVGEKITAEQGVKYVEKYLVGYDVEKIEYAEANAHRIPSYLYNVVLKGGRQCSVQIAQNGGMLLLIDLFHNVEEPTLTIEQCKKVAEQYCESIGLSNMKAVWMNNNQSNVYINMCNVQNGIVIYPDMVKIKVSLDTGEVIGYEGLNYAFNHTVRELATPKISEEQAVLGVSAVLDNIKVSEVVIPWNVTSEKVAYEIVGELNGETYFVYVDAYDGTELNVLRMIDSNQGELLM